MTALEQRIQTNHATRMTTTIKVHIETLQQFRMAKIRYMSRKNIIRLNDSDFLEKFLMEMSQ
tara:strand:+ start:400 stop:585 length:186 start_codon:yes stop_codon:yes gene_type:complete